MTTNGAVETEEPQPRAELLLFTQRNRIMTDPKYESFNTLPDQEEPDLEHWNTEAMRKAALSLTITFMRAGASRILSLSLYYSRAQYVLNKYFLNG